MLLISILNFPPELRRVLGVGLHLIASHLSTVKGLKKTLFMELLNADLNFLGNGFEITIRNEFFYCG